MLQPSKAKLSRITRLLFSLLAFLTFTQAALHFWPSYAYLYGVRIDYFSPALYLTDVLIVLLLTTFLIDGRNRKVYFSTSFVLPFLLALCFALVNSALATAPTVALWKWAKLFLLIFLFRLVSLVGEEDKLKYIVKPLLFSIPLVVGIGVVQMFLQKSTGWFSLLGERTFTLATPGIAARTIFGSEILRAYSSFSHPNSLAGFLLISLLLIVWWFQKGDDKQKRLLSLLFGTTLLGIFISLSYSVWIYVLVMFLLAYFKPGAKVLFLLPFVSFVFVIISKTFSLRQFSFLPQAITERLSQFAQIDVTLTKDLLFGAGLNNSILVQAKTTFKSFTFQPIHNGFLLLFVETGVLGLSLFLVAFQKLARGFKQNKIEFLIFIAVLLLFLFDHYQLTLQQNMLISTIALGLIY